MSRFVSGNRVELLRAGTEYFPALEAACDAAQHEIYLETYIFEDDATGQRIGAALARAARRGVIVYVMIDGFGSKDLGDDFVLALREAGIRVLVYRPQISPWTLRRERLRRLHRKVVVVDARIAFVGGINIIDDMHTPRQVPPRFDYAVRIEGPLLAPIHASVVNLWTLVMWTQFRRRGPLNKIPVQHAPSGSRRGAFVVRDNLRHRNDIERAYLEAIGNASVEVVIANAYFFPGKSFRRALASAAARGVRVVLLLQGRVEYVLLHYASRALYRFFLDAGVEIYEYHRSFLHAKVAVIDDRWSTVGSSNIDPMSLLLAREANVLIDDAAFARELKTSLNDAMALGAERVDAATWKHQSLTARIMTWVCYGLVRFMTGWSSYGRAREFR
ncbi:MAG: phospholipase D/Transphosphatidylase [Betaproteobacteria bacterium]|nr:phospholipase D/Transphosphatidylase [Betaproteobacteria bacterium]